MNDNKLFVGNLSFNTTENDLQDMFAAHGTVTEANLMMDRATGKPRGFGFVTMSTAEEAQKALAALNGQAVDGRALTVNVAAAADNVASSAAVAIAINAFRHGRDPFNRVPACFAFFEELFRR
jgi:RNA recognition motif-containing protein